MVNSISENSSLAGNIGQKKRLSLQLTIKRYLLPRIKQFGPFASAGTYKELLTKNFTLKNFLITGSLKHFLSQSSAAMCDHEEVIYKCGHLRYLVMAWCNKYCQIHFQCGANPIKRSITCIRISYTVRLNLFGVQEQTTRRKLQSVILIDCTEHTSLTDTIGTCINHEQRRQWQAKYLKGPKSLTV